ncbi:MAG: molybdate ABC transporter permease subunit, partial [Gemmatimonadota bacterium]|nr:molybdate ABC transporter permease subunit [Gemmatimonadota bacterium]
MFHKAKTSARWAEPKRFSLWELRRKTILIAVWSMVLLAPTQLKATVSTEILRKSEQASDSVLLVLAAASLADVLPRIGDEWERLGGTPLVFSFDATSRLAVQASQSGSGDLFFSADPQWIRWLEEQGAIAADRAVHLAANDLVIAVSRDVSVPVQPDMLSVFERIALAGENVPAGRYARMALEQTGAWSELEGRIVRGGSVRGALEWVARGEVPAGIVYRTDAEAEPSVRIAFVFEAPEYPQAQYWGVPLGSTVYEESATDFLNFVLGDSGQSFLREAGFSRPQSDMPDGEEERYATGDTGDELVASVSSAIRLSLIIAFLATLAGLVPAVGLGWLLARRDFRGKTILSTVVTAPLVIPPVVTGFLLLSVLGASTPLGGLIASLGFPVPFTILGASIAALVVGLPLYVISVRGAFEAVDPMYEELSWTLGSSPRRTFFRISLPLALPGIAAGAVLAFARSLGEFGATVVLAGNVEGSTRTIALAVYTLLESPTGRETVWVLVGASVVISLIA